MDHRRVIEPLSTRVRGETVWKFRTGPISGPHELAERAEKAPHIDAARYQEDARSYPSGYFPDRL